MRYILLETRTHANEQVGTTITSYDNEDEAKSKYYTALANAYKSTVPRHGAFLLTDTGTYIKSEYHFYVPTEPSEEPETSTEATEA